MLFNPNLYHSQFNSNQMATKKKPIHLSIIMDKLSDLGWEYTCNRMSRSGMQVYDELMTYLGGLDKGEHWNEDAYADANGDW